MSQIGARCGIFRVKQVKRHPGKSGKPGARNLIGHMLRERVQVPNANSALKSQNTHLAGGESIEKCLEIVDSAIALHNDNVSKDVTKTMRKFRSDGVAALDFYFGGSNKALGELSRDEQDAYFRDCMKWALREYLNSDDLNDNRIVTCDIHRDEKTPHMHLIIVPFIDGRMCGSSLMGDSANLHDKQNRFFDNVSSKYGLERGEIGSGAKHVPAGKLHALRSLSIEQVRSDPNLQSPPLPIPVPPPRPRGLLQRPDPADVEARDTYVAELEKTASRQQQVVESLKTELINAKATPAEFVTRRTGIRAKLARVAEMETQVEETRKRNRNRARRAIAIAKAAREKSRLALAEAKFQDEQNARDYMRNLETEIALDARQANLNREVKKRAEARAEELARALVEERTRAEQQRLEQAQRECNQTQAQLQQERIAIPLQVAQQVQANTLKRSCELDEALRKCKSERAQLQNENNSLQAEKTSFENARAGWVDWYKELKAFHLELRTAARSVDVFSSRWQFRSPKAWEALSMGTDVLKNVLTAACQLASGQPEEVEKATCYLKQLYPEFPSSQGIDAVDINTLAGPRPPVIPECPAIPEHLLSSPMSPPASTDDRKSSRRIP